MFCSKAESAVKIAKRQQEGARYKGREDGVQAKKQAVAINCLKMGSAVDQISQGIGLTIQQIEKICLDM